VAHTQKELEKKSLDELMAIFVTFPVNKDDTATHKRMLIALILAAQTGE
jgi:hypothetical protein